MKGEEVIRTNLSLCLRGEALLWHVDKLTDYDRAALRGRMQSWYEKLVERFRENPGVAWSKLLTAKYTRNDLLNGVTPGSYVSRVARLATATNSGNALLTAWNGLKPEMRKDILMPDETTSQASFVQLLQSKRHLWENLFSRI